MKTRTYLWLAAGLLCGAALAACGKLDPITQPQAQSGRANFSTYVAMGTSITAGWQSGGLVQHHQTKSYAYLFARQADASAFTIPSVSADGVPPLLRIVSLNPLIISRAGRTQGTFTNVGQPTSYHNMAVSSAIVADATDSTNYYVGLNLERIEQFENIVRHRGTIVQQVLGHDPTFISIEYGSGEVLGAATSGIGTPILSPQAFGFYYRAMLDSIRVVTPQAKLALFTVPDVTTIPFFTTFPPLTVSLTTGQPVPLIGPDGPLAPADLVLLRAADSLAVGAGIPVGAYNYINPTAPGNGRPLLNSQVLNALEGASIQAAVAAFNDTIRFHANQRGAAVVDLNGLLHDAATEGLSFAGHDYTTDFVTGGLFSLDGVHPTDLAHGFLANLMIDAVNAKFAASIPRVNLSESATATSSRLKPVGGRKTYPWIQGADRLCPIPVMPGDVIAAR
ncbi:MAG TPA: SGNH/GDSL hydrolase family protein [Candidatus Eisenbacteria bacterium]|nr:SGNH/GDSL hydrolase family protein [Candidatus Eisenbacteria bacterium]